MFTEKNITELINQAKNMQEKIKEIKKNIKTKEIIGKSGAGLVKMTITGTYDCKNVTINKKIINQESKNILEDLIAAAFNDAIRQIENIQKEQLNINQ
ncbi:YbaB/EbfC family nucleoid-associated protein [Buchnera aphidicola]|uniref:YbaB/EbfC family nucleoid-associated protein n=1 Tax=Buchnera aphidicola TaxID=9 RepID=UPI00094CAF1A|nr:YbaB/EbfC family nucleoid-associated protein [Buchnera aphidicola]